MRHSTRNFRPALERLEERTLLSAAPALAYVQTNLVSNIQGMAQITDPKLVNPWDINFPQQNGLNPPIVVADQGTGVATSYQISTDGSTVSEAGSPVMIPTVGSSEPSGPTGVVQNTDSQGFFIPGPDGVVSAAYIFDTLQGTIGGLTVNNTGDINSAQIVPNNISGAEYTGLAAGIVTDPTTGNVHSYIYAANEGTDPGIQVFDSSFGPVQLPNSKGNGGNANFTGNFTDTSLPAGFVPYGVRDLSLSATGGKQDADLFVTYRGPNFQGGAVAVFTNSGTFLGQFDEHGGKPPITLGIGLYTTRFVRRRRRRPLGRQFQQRANRRLHGHRGQPPGRHARLGLLRTGQRFSTRTARRSQFPGSRLSISAPAWGIPVFTSPCSSPQTALSPSPTQVGMGTSRSTA